MILNGLDWAIIAVYLLLSFGIGIVYRHRAGRSLADYFVSGRSLPWWIAGTSMVATTFAADTPLAVTGLVARHGLAGNWFWWAFALGGMITVFVYARMWRRSEVLTDVELVELRYGGRPAAFLRGFRAIYVALLLNSIIMGWVTGAMITVLEETVFAGRASLPGGEWGMTLMLLGIVGAYSTLAGMWGVAITDFFQFVLAMAGSIILAVVAVGHLGGAQAMRAQVVATFPGGEDAFRFFPDFTAADPWMPVGVFLAMLFVQWWATWYPGAEPGGGGYIVQRMASAKDERHSVLATLWFQIAHYCVRPWPWLMVAFAALALYPDLRTLDNPGVGFPRVMRDLAPAGVRGLLVVAFFSAFMSTIATQLNWGASYLVNDVYKRFVRPEAGDRHLTRVSRAASVLVLAAGSVAAWLMRDISVDEAWKLLTALGAGTGAVFMLRWFWWRINAWSEIVAMVVSLVAFLVLSQLIETVEYRMAAVAGVTIAAWLVATWATKPESPETLERFYRKVRPGGPGWGPLARAHPGVEVDRHLGLSVAAAVLAAGIVYFTLPAIGFVLFGEYLKGALCFGGAAACAGVVVALVKRIGWGRVVG
ncbi:MAG TPA: sodium:solute symporter family protein [Longimicrobiales bacterium]|nr:sodium:solute symporter family protein [Longimicrobiales bacterium]